MHALTTRTTSTRLLACGLAVGAILLAAFASTASASWNEWSGHNLPGYTWTAGNDAVQSALFHSAGGANTTSDVCVGPVTHDGSGFHAPYGWSCEPGSVEWSYSPLSAATALYNPNPGTFGNYSAIGVGE